VRGGIIKLEDDAGTRRNGETGIRDQTRYAVNGVSPYGVHPSPNSRQYLEASTLVPSA
jgi:hypothetical protein